MRAASGCAARRPRPMRSRGFSARRRSRRASSTRRSSRFTRSVATRRSAVLHDEADHRRHARRDLLATPASRRARRSAARVRRRLPRDRLRARARTSSIAISSRRTSCSATTARSTCSTGASRASRRRGCDATAGRRRRRHARRRDPGGAMLGTPGYMAPEQMRTRTPSARQPTSTRSARSCSRSSPASRFTEGRGPHQHADRHRRLAGAASPRTRMPPELDALCVAALAPRPGKAPDRARARRSHRRLPRR